MGRAIHAPSLPPIWNEQFVGAYSLVPALFPNIDIDTNLVLQRYDVLDEIKFLADTTNWASVDTHYFSALPEVGAGTRTTSASPIYLYKAKAADTASSVYHGKVMGVAQDLNGMRSLSFLFTPISVPDDQANELFRVSLTWLMDKFLRREGSRRRRSPMTKRI